MTAGPKPGSQCARILAVLADGKPKTVPTIHRRAGTMRLNSRIAELRSRYGHDIVCERLPHRKGASAYRYTWIDAPGISEPDTDDFTLSPDDWAPRTPQERYRIYGRPPYGDIQLIATVATPEALGVAIVTLGGEREFENYHLGILDTHGTATRSGEWLVKPWIGETL